jgi:UDP-2-acetamido-3-amino-2,3-dideoxy-glucuronate N-acetyltransferase
VKDLALVGVGHWGKNLARNFNRLGALAAVCDVNEIHLQMFKENYPDIRATVSYEEILNDSTITKIAIAVPTPLHFSFVEKALQAGKDVFVEKSMCTCPAEALTLARLAERGARILMVGHILHYHPAISVLKRVLQDRMIGTVHHYMFNRLNFGSMGEEKSALWAFAPHDISILLAFNKEFMLESVQSTHNSYFHETIFDQSHIHINFLEGIGADIHVSWMNPFRERKITIIGSEGMLVFDDLKDWHEKISCWKSSVYFKEGKLIFKQENATRIPIEPKKILHDEPIYEEPLFIECRHFLNSCMTREPPLTDGWEGLRVIQVLDAAQRSAYNNGELMSMLEKDVYIKRQE